MFQFKTLAQYPQIVHQVTQKDPSLPFAGSLALHTQEHPPAILGNRAKLEAQYPTMHFVVANQTHSANVQVVQSDQSYGWQNPSDAIKDCDALLTNQKGVMLTILTADCVPILLFDPIHLVIGAVHAGWRGTQEQIVRKSIEKMQEVFGSDPKDIIAGIAPAIGRCCYEVNKEVAKHFFDDPHAMDQQGEKYMLDLPYINSQQLLQAGVNKKNIERSNICTACEVENYFSYRKEHGCSGRFMSMIGLIKQP